MAGQRASRICCAVGRCAGSMVSSLRTQSLAASEMDGHGAVLKSMSPCAPASPYCCTSSSSTPHVKNAAKPALLAQQG